jgi:LPXTG-site transpeptidase (sortase) family protein
MKRDISSKTASLLAAVFLILAAALAFITLSSSGGNGGQVGERAETEATASPESTVGPQAAAANPDALPPARILLPKLGVDAPIVLLGVLPNGAMDAPSKPLDVAWYTFSAKPGQPGNVVMSGHVDFVNYGPAVFARLDEMSLGDEVAVQLENGATLKYLVQSVDEYVEAEAPVQKIVGPTPNEAITLITCSGSFDARSRTYDKRLVVRAARVEG